MWTKAVAIGLAIFLADCSARPENPVRQNVNSEEESTSGGVYLIGSLRDGIKSKEVQNGGKSVGGVVLGDRIPEDKALEDGIYFRPEAPQTNPENSRKRRYVHQAGQKGYGFGGGKLDGSGSGRHNESLENILQGILNVPESIHSHTAGGIVGGSDTNKEHGTHGFKVTTEAHGSVAAPGHATIGGGFVGHHHGFNDTSVVQGETYGNAHVNTTAFEGAFAGHNNVTLEHHGNFEANATASGEGSISVNGTLESSQNETPTYLFGDNSGHDKHENDSYNQVHDSAVDSQAGQKDVVVNDLIHTELNTTVVDSQSGTHNGHNTNVSVENFENVTYGNSEHNSGHTVIENTFVANTSADVNSTQIDSVTFVTNVTNGQSSGNEARVDTTIFTATQDNSTFETKVEGTKIERESKAANEAPKTGGETKVVVGIVIGSPPVIVPDNSRRIVSQGHYGAHGFVPPFGFNSPNGGYAPHHTPHFNYAPGYTGQTGYGFNWNLGALNYGNTFPQNFAGDGIPFPQNHVTAPGYQNEVGYHVGYNHPSSVPVNHETHTIISNTKHLIKQANVDGSAHGHSGYAASEEPHKGGLYNAHSPIQINSVYEGAYIPSKNQHSGSATTNIENVNTQGHTTYIQYGEHGAVTEFAYESAPAPSDQTTVHDPLPNRKKTVHPGEAGRVPDNLPQEKQTVSDYENINSKSRSSFGTSDSQPVKPVLVDAIEGTALVGYGHPNFVEVAITDEGGNNVQTGLLKRPK